MRTWMKETRDVILPQSSVSCSTTVYVAVGNVLAGPHFMFGRSTNSIDFRRFLEELRWSRTDSMDADYYLVLDGKFHPGSTHKSSLCSHPWPVGATSHRCKENNIEQIVRSPPIRVFFNPPGCSFYNSAETVISILKQSISKAFALRTADFASESQIRSFIWAELQKVKRQLRDSRVMYSCVPELLKGLHADRPETDLLQEMSDLTISLK